MTVTVNKKGNPRDFSFLFPSMVFVADVPRFESYVYTTRASMVKLWETLVAGNRPDSLLLVQSSAGYPVDTVVGLQTFLRHIGYMSDSKIDRLSRLDGLACPDLYRNAATLRLSNRLFVDIVDEPVPSVLELLDMGLYRAVDVCLRAGCSRALVSLLSSLYRFWSRDGSLSATAYRDWSYALNAFTVDVFLDRFVLSGNDETDLLLLLSLLPYRTS